MLHFSLKIPTNSCPLFPFTGTLSKDSPFFLSPIVLLALSLYFLPFLNYNLYIIIFTHFAYTAQSF